MAHTEREVFMSFLIGDSLKGKNLLSREQILSFKTVPML